VDYKIVGTGNLFLDWSRGRDSGRLIFFLCGMFGRLRRILTCKDRMRPYASRLFYGKKGMLSEMETDIVGLDWETG